MRRLLSLFRGLLLIMCMCAHTSIGAHGGQRHRIILELQVVPRQLMWVPETEVFCKSRKPAIHNETLSLKKEEEGAVALWLGALAALPEHQV